jgi:hypothetical protein
LIGSGGLVSACAGVELAKSTVQPDGVVMPQVPGQHPAQMVLMEVAGRLGCPGAVRVRGDTGQVNPARAVLDNDQRVYAPQEHGVHVDKIDGEHTAGLGGEELLPRRAGAAGCGADPGVMQDLPHRRRSDPVAE